MSEDKDLVQYDDSEAIKYIMSKLPKNLRDKLSDNDINYVVDIMYEFYESKGFMDGNLDDENTVEINETELVEYVVATAKMDKSFKLTHEEVTSIILGELNYCDSLGLFEK